MNDPLSHAARRYAAPQEVYRRLQVLSDQGHIQLLTVWCSEKGSLPANGHFCGQGTTHLPETFQILPEPGLGVELHTPEPLTFTIPLPLRAAI